MLEAVVEELDNKLRRLKELELELLTDESIHTRYACLQLNDAIDNLSKVLTGLRHNIGSN